MKRSLIAVALVLSLLAHAARGAAPAKFTGTWLLNRAKSEGLQNELPGSEWLLVVTQDEKKIYVEQQIKIRGRQQPGQELAWNLDGSPSRADVVRPLAGMAELQAKWSEAGKALELTSTIKGDNQGSEITVSIKETWQLSATGKVLQIARTRTSPQGRQTFKLYFEKQP